MSKKEEPTQEELQAAADYMAEEQHVALEFLEAMTIEYRKYRKKLTGRLLTIIDAITVDDAQRKAIKDLVHNAIEQHAQESGVVESAIYNRVSESLYGDKAGKLVNGPMDISPFSEELSVYLPPLIMKKKK